MSKTVFDALSKRTQIQWSAFFCIRELAIALSLLALILINAVSIQADDQKADNLEKKPAVHLEGVSIERIDWEKKLAETRLTIAIDNPGPSFALRDLKYRLKLNDKEAAEGKYESVVRVPGHSKTSLELPCSVDLKMLPVALWSFIAGGFETHYEFETEFTIPIFPSFNPTIKRSISGDMSLAASVSGWTAKIKEQLSKK